MEWFSSLQPLHGFDGGLGWDQRLDDSVPRSHVQAPYHVTPYATTTKARGERTLAVLAYAGKSGEEAKAWHVRSGAAGHWVLEHPVLGEWELSHPVLPFLQ